ncbi:MAG TPA: site-2 protease family protein [Candidatus Andersenbacteria bacterium]|nr:MAG: hypothetical protein A2854_01595 [Parcubacteria group bacterium RIFCSPHIGHO2_01_FULL_56_18]HLD26153.1 site-2 protease family protein [Candidatus Andersenbacteria bacterium]
MLVLTIVVFVGLLLALVLVHEWGHFAAARRAGCRVEEFAFGFPPRLFSITRGGTRYSFNLLPLGGYVKIEGEDMAEATPSPTSFAGKSAGWRIFILAAGVLMNVVLAAALLSWQVGIGVPTLVTEENEARVVEHKAFIVSVANGSPAATAGLQSLDRVMRVGPIQNPRVRELQQYITEHAGEAMTLTVSRQGLTKTVEVTARENPPAGEGALGVGLQETGLARTPWWQAPWRGVQRTGEMLVSIVSQFWLMASRLLSGQAVGETITGPVGIAVLTHEVTTLGLSYLLEFAALISLNLALINILPLPALDGGRILFVGFELLFRRRLPAKIEQYAHLAGFVALIALMLVITFRDVKRFF